MTPFRRVAGVLLVCICTVAGGSTMGLLASEAASGDASGTFGSTLILARDFLSVPGVQQLNGGEQDRDQLLADRSNPQAALARLSSRTAYERLGSQAAASLARHALPAVVAAAPSGLGQIPAGAHIVRYVSSNAAEVTLPAGRRGIVESLTPIATGHGGKSYFPLDLGLRQGVRGFSPAADDVKVSIAKSLSQGSALANGVSLTPVDSSGRALHGSGRLDGSSVFYPASTTDTDTVIKPTSTGFETYQLLRSVHSPEGLSFRLGLPSHARVERAGSAGAVRVVRGGRTLAVVPAAVATDATGAPVPVSSTLSGRTLRLRVAHRAGDFAYPIAVDPTVIDSELTGALTNWRIEKGGPSEGSNFWGFNEHSAGWVINTDSTHQTNQWGGLLYPTQGESHIYEVSMESSAADSGANVENHIVVFGKKGSEEPTWEARTGMSTSYGRTSASACVKEGCASGGGNAGNVAGYWVNAIGTGSGGEARVYTASVYIEQANGPSASFDTTDATLGGGSPNVLYGGGSWWGPKRGELQAIGKDPGVGVREIVYEDGTHKWTAKPVGGCVVECPELEEQPNGFTSVFGVGHEALPDGESTLTIKAVNGMGAVSGAASTKVKVDATAPTEVTLSGLPSGNTITDANRTVKIVGKAKDGSGSTPSSGIGSLKLLVDGKETGSPSGSCSPGPCSATGEWTIKGEDYGAGSHTIAVTASDGAGNTATTEATLTVHHASTMGFGPGDLNPVTGEFDLEETDVSVNTANSPLQITRAFNSRDPEGGVEGPLGAPWALSLGGAQSVVQMPNGNAMLVDVGGHKSVFDNIGSGHYSSPTGDTGLILTKTGEEFKLVKKGTTVAFTHISGDVEGLYRPTLSTGTTGTSSTFYSYQVVAGITEPGEILAPVPSGVSCAPELKQGCRALTFNYATTTTATGEAPSQWGDYKGRLTRVYLNAYDPVSKAMKTTTIAQYSYDGKGRLRAVWDPRVSPALKTTYGYNVEGLLTSVNPPGREPSIFGYGTVSADTSPGRLVSLYSPQASTALGSGVAPSSSTAPTLSGSTVVGVRMTVSDGTWSESPLTYGYQWERCSSTGTECLPIGGAVNANYTPTSSDIGHALVAQVTAANSGGAVAAVTAATLPVTATATPSFTQQIDAGSSLNAVSCVPGTTTCVGSDSKGKAFYSTNVSSTGSATWTSWTGPGASPSEAVSCPSTSLCLMAAGSQGGNGGSLYYSTSLGGSWSLAYTPSYGVDAVSCVSSSFCVDGQDAFGYFRYATSPGSTSWTLESQGGAAMKAVSCISTSFCAIADSMGNVHIATSTAQIESSTWTETKVDGTSALNGIACTSTTSCVAVDGSGNALSLAISGGVATATKHNIDGTNSINGVACPTSTRCVVVDNQGNAFVSNNAGETWALATLLGDNLTSVSCPSSSLCLAGGSAGNVASFNPAGGGATTEGEARNPTSARTTVEYGVAVSGSGSPYAMSSSDVAKWAQTDVPAEATAVFPPDEPMGWPASDYRRATVYYLDGSDRVVNTASPNGGISTQEYNSYGDVVRALTPDNREAALKEGAKSAETSQTLDSQSTYGSEGAELLEKLGPLHSVQLANGTQVQARHHTVYSYDESAPPGGPYRLVTKVTDGAQITGQAEADVRTRKISYAGQNNLGWVLRAPTSETVDPSGLKLARTTVYDPTSGNVTETRTPGAGAPNEEVTPYLYSSTFGSFGTGSGQMEKPYAMTFDSSGNLWLADYYNSRIEEFSSGGTLLRTFGEFGHGNGQLDQPQGIATDSEGRVWVADTLNNRIERFSSTGVYQTQFKGSPEHTELKAPDGIAMLKQGSTQLLVIVDRGNERVVEFKVIGLSYFATVATVGTGDGQVKRPEGVRVDSSNNIWVADTGNNRVQEFSGESSTFLQKFGTHGSGEGQLSEPHGIGVDSEGNVLVADGGNSRIMEFSGTGAYLGKFGTKGTGEAQMINPTDVVLDASNNAFVMDGNSRVEKWTPHLSNHESSGTGGTYGKQTIYYTTAANSQTPACGEHPEWASLPCETKPAAQPETTGVPNLPVTTFTYDMGDEPLTSVETVGSTTRTTTNSYDEAERLVNVSVTSTEGTSLPSTKLEYNSESGALIKQSAVIEGATKTIETSYDKRGEIVSYKDADGNTATDTYDVDGRPETLNDGKGTQTYGYDTTTGLLTKLTDSAAGTFTAAYDAEGELVTAGYPNGMNVNHTINHAGEQTGISYVKTTNCESGCTWYSETEVPSIHGQTLSQSSTLSSQTFSYDEAGRLTKAQDTPAGQGCTTRIYAYDVETNISSLTTRPSVGEGECASEGGTAVNHSYDTANRLTDSGIAYNTFGDITTLPAADAGGSQVTSSYYVDNTLAGQTQNGQTIGYNLDPIGRPRQTVSTGTVNSTVTSHYADGGQAAAWSEDTGGKWTRQIQGLEGSLVAVQTNGEAPVLQVEDLHGNIVATASLGETAHALLSKNDTTEYGVPRTSTPPKYSWQGAATLPTELPSGIVAMGARSYVPQVGRFLQPDPVEGGSANAYAYTFGDPVGSHDPSGEFTVEMPEWVGEFLDEQAEIATEEAIERAAEEEAARIEAEEKAAEAAAEAAEAAAGGGSRHGHHGGSHHAGRGSFGGRRASLLSCKALYCDKSGIKLCKTEKCDKHRKKEAKIKAEHKREKEESEKRIKEEAECGGVRSDYHPEGGAFGLNGGLYYSGLGKLRDILCEDGGDPTVPCVPAVECDDPGLEAYEGPDPRVHVRKV